MKNILISILVLGVSKFALAADFAPSKRPLKEFCEAPYKTVCGENQREVGLRTDRIKRIENALKAPALKAAFEFLYGKTADGLEEFNETALRKVSPKAKRKKAVKIFLSELRQQLRKYLSENKAPTHMGIPVIKDALMEAIHRSTDIETEIREKMIKSVQETRVITLADLDSDFEDASHRDVMELYHQCSNDLFMDNALATEIRNQKVVILCPGEVIGSIEFARNQSLPPGYGMGVLIMTLGHELSHHFDYSVFPEAYQSLLEGMHEVRGEFALPEDITKYMSEITADTWGIKTFAIATAHLQPQGVRTTLLRGALSDLCGTEDDGEHPSGIFRINHLPPMYLCQ